MSGPVIELEGMPIPIVNYPSVWIEPRARCRKCKRKPLHPVYVTLCEDCWVDQLCPKARDKSNQDFSGHRKSGVLSKCPSTV